MTVSGADPNKACIFLFKFDGVRHDTCIWDDAHPSAPSWCSTLVDDQGKHVGGQGKWGNCEPDCPTAINYNDETKPLPGEYHNITYPQLFPPYPLYS